MTEAGILVVGAGQAGFQLAASLREGGFAGKLTLLGDEVFPPYQRPPLSKAFLKGADIAEALEFRPAAWFAKHDVALRLGERAVAIDPAAQYVETDRGATLPYQGLVLATGARNRVLKLPGAALGGVISVRDVPDAMALRAALAQARRVVIVGGGFLGLEVAASARAMGAEVHVIEAADRLMGRAISPAVSAWFLAYHRAQGIVIQLGQTLSAITGTTRAAGVRTTEGEEIPADLVVVAVGVVANIELAEAAGLAVDRGIVVDHRLRTSDPLVHALGDCALFPGVRAAA